MLLAHFFDVIHAHCELIRQITVHWRTSLEQLSMQLDRTAVSDDDVFARGVAAVRL